MVTIPFFNPRRVPLTPTKLVDAGFMLILALMVLFTLRHTWPAGLFYTHDGFLQFMRSAHFWSELGQGQFPVRWATQMSEGFGYPEFNFTYVGPYYLASLFSWLGTSVTGSLKLLTLGSAIISTLGWYLWLRFYFKPTASLMGAVMSWLAPYRFLMVFVTGQLGTLTGWLWVPFLLIGLQLSILNRGSKLNARTLAGVILAAVSIAGLIATHLITALVVAPLLAMIMVGQLGWEWSVVPNQAGRAKAFLVTKIIFLVATGLLGLGLSASYWLPAMLELPLVRAGHQAVVPYAEHFPTLSQLIYSAWGYGYSMVGAGDGMSFQVGLGQWGALGLAGGLLVWVVYRLLMTKKYQMQSTDILAGSTLIAAGLVIFLMLPVSQFIWELFPFWQTIQHPWRLLLAVVLASSVATSYIVSKKYGWVVGLGLVALALFNTRNYMRPMELKYYSDQQLRSEVGFNRTGDVSDEFLPIWARSSSPKPSNPVLDLKPNTKLALTTTASAQVTLHTFYFPTWQVLDAGQPLKTSYNNQGLLTVDLGAGDHSLELRSVKTPIQTLADSLTAFSLTCLLLFAIIPLWKRP